MRKYGAILKKSAGVLLRIGIVWTLVVSLLYYYSLWKTPDVRFVSVSSASASVRTGTSAFQDTLFLSDEPTGAPSSPDCTIALSPTAVSPSLPSALSDGEAVHPETGPVAEHDTFPAPGKYCLACHQGVEPPRPFSSGMMRQILARSAALGDPNGCVVCHGGQPKEIWSKYTAHAGVPEGSSLTAFTPVPGALQVNEQTCGTCHADHTYNIRRSNMNTDAGKIKAILWSWGIETENHDHLYGDHATDDPDGLVPRLGSDTYKAYMQEMSTLFPGQYPDHLQKIPAADLSRLDSLPQQAAFTYLRNCNACHLSNKGMQDRGHYRGMGCAACHNVYGNEGFYEGGDASIDKQTPGHVLVHAMQGTRKSPVSVNGKQYSGIQVSTCAACHAAGRRIGHAYQGLMALDHTDNRGPFDAEGHPQQTNAGYVFKYIRDDAHHQVDKDGRTVTGLLCQDCHVTTSMHGNGNIGTTTLATVEIECTDCHGTPTRLPWELPTGYGDEFGRIALNTRPRGLADEPMETTIRFATVYPPQDGYLLSARGNALGNVVKDSNRVIVHSATGLDFEAPLLKQIASEETWSHPVEARTAMVAVPQHIDRLECYACHSTWSPQYYGYTYGIDYRQTSVDWIDSPEIAQPDGTTADYHGRPILQPGAPAFGDYSHIRWENPPLGINGEGRVSPLTGVIQTIATVIGPKGKTILSNQVAQTAQGYNAMELAPLNPHTTSKAARECADCHGNPQAMGYGMDGGSYDATPSLARYADVVTADGEIVSRYTRPQIVALPQLHGDFMQLLDHNDRQMQTVDSHWPDARPLTVAQRDKLARQGTCAACHQDIPDGSLPMKMLGKVAEVTRLSFAPASAHAKLLRENNIGIAWVKIAAIIGGILFVAAGSIWLFRKLKRKGTNRFGRRKRYGYGK